MSSRASLGITDLLLPPDPDLSIRHDDALALSNKEPRRERPKHTRGKVSGLTRYATHHHRLAPYHQDQTVHLLQRRNTADRT